MRQFLSASLKTFEHQGAGESKRVAGFGKVWVGVPLLALLASAAMAQQAFPTSRGANSRAGANINETLLTPSNVNQNSFGKLFSAPIDYVAMAQPLYVPNVNIPNQGTHNVVYVVTQADSVYAIDADNGAHLWYATMLNVGGTTASGKYLPCGTAVGFNQEGIVGTPVIDPNTNTMYLVAKTLLNGTVRHHLHALDITTGNEQPASPTLITATSVSSKGTVMHFNSLHQKNRPGLLLQNGVVYLGFGSNYCNDGNSGWVLAYDAASLTQLNVYNTSPDYGYTSIWQAGNGLAADDAGNLYVETAESGAHGFDVPMGGQTYCNSVIKLSPTLQVSDYFTPWYVAFLNAHDLDLSSTGTLLLPDQSGPWPHELIASGKQGIIYVLNRDALGMYSVGNDSRVIQETSILAGISSSSTGEVQFGSPAYWNNHVYFAPHGAPIVSFPLQGDGTLGTPLTTGKYVGSHSPSVSANGTSNGVLWVISGPQLLAFDAVSLQFLYGTGQAPKNRDLLPAVGHFVTQTVANGKVYVATQNSLVAYALFDIVNLTGGQAQTGVVGTTLSAPLQIQAVNPYSGQADAGATVNFSDGGKGGTFAPPSVVTDAHGNASTSYTLPKKSGRYTLTISGTGFGNVTTTALATPSTATQLVVYSGAKQTGYVGTNLALPLVAQVQDAYKNGVSGVTVNFLANKAAVPNPASAVSDSTGRATTILQLPTVPANVTVTFNSPGLKAVNNFPEYAVAGPAAYVAVTGGNNQLAAAGSQLPQPLTVAVSDQFANPVSGIGVYFADGGAGGMFSTSNPVVTDRDGGAAQLYTLPAGPASVTISATVNGLPLPAVFTETGQ